MTSRAAIAGVVAALAGAGCPSPKPDPTGPTSPIHTTVATVDAAPPRPQPTPSEHAVHLASGMVIETLTPGGGEHPVGNDRLTLRLHAWSAEGELGDSSEYTGDLSRVPSGLGEAITHMLPGETARVWVPTVDVHDRDDLPVVIDLRLEAVQVAPPVPPDVAAPPPGATRSALGVSSLVVTKGGGTQHPRPNDEVLVAFTVWNADGDMLETTAWDSSRTWTVSRFGRGLTEALTGMVVGETARFWVPGKLTAQYDDGTDTILTYQFELLELHPKPLAPGTPTDVAAPPRSAKKTGKGVRYRFLHRGIGKTHPAPTDQVKVNYSGWTTDGVMFDSSAQRGQPAIFPLNGVIAGWTDVLQVMAPGDKIRCWIPEALAYAGQSGRPQGMLVFDIELIEIEKQE